MIKMHETWKKVMKETKGAWCKHPVFKEIDDAVEIVNWMRGKNEEFQKIYERKMKTAKLRKTLEGFDKEEVYA